MEKAAINLRDTLYQLQALREENTWDGIVRKRSIDYGRLVFPKKNVDLELAERVKAARKGCKAGLERKLKNFADDSAQVLADLAQSADGARGLAGLGAEDELCLLVVLNTASIQLIPSTIAAVRASQGAVSAFDITPAVWISSVLSVCAGLGAAAVLRRLWR